MGAFAEQVKVEVAQDRRKAVGVIEFDDVVAEARAQLIARWAVWQRAGEQAGFVDSLEFGPFAVLADRLDIGGLGQEGAHNVLAALAVQAEIVKGVGMLALDDRISLGG